MATSSTSSLTPQVSKYFLTYKIAAHMYHNGATYMEIREIIIYIFFMAMLISFTYGAYTPNAYHLAAALKNSFIDRIYYCDGERTNLYNVSSLDDVWCYLKNRLVKTIKEHPFWGEKETLNETMMLTHPRLRQVRVKREDCWIPITKDGCYGEFLSSTEEKDVHMSQQYSPPETMGNIWFKGLISYYNSAGYYFLLRDEKQLDFYQKNNWIDQQTRALFIDFTVYSLNTNLFCVCQILLEFPPSGGVNPTYLFNSLKFIRYNDKSDHIILACEIVFAFLCCYYTFELCCDIAHFKQKFFTTFDNWVDLLILTLSWSSVGLLINREYASRNFMETHITRQFNEFTDYQVLKYIQLTSDRTTAVTLFCAFLKGYRFLHIDTIHQLFTTLKYCFWDIIHFCLLFIVILFAYAEFGTLIFSNYLQSYKTFPTSVFTLLRIMMGEFRYQELRSIYHNLGPIYIVSFVIVVNFLFLNMFLAIINSTYSAVSCNVRVVRKTEYKPFIRHCAGIALKKFHPTLVTEKPRKKSNSERVKEVLKDSGFTELEIDMFFSKYTIDNDRVIPEEVFQKIVTKKVKQHHIEELKRQVDKVEQSFAIILAKKEYFLDKVANLTRR